MYRSVKNKKLKSAYWLWNSYRNHFFWKLFPSEMKSYHFRKTIRNLKRQSNSWFHLLLQNKGKVFTGLKLHFMVFHYFWLNGLSTNSNRFAVSCIDPLQARHTRGLMRRSPCWLAVRFRCINAASPKMHTSLHNTRHRVIYENAQWNCPTVWRVQYFSDDDVRWNESIWPHKTCALSLTILSALPVLDSTFNVLLSFHHRGILGS